MKRIILAVADLLEESIHPGSRDVPGPSTEIPITDTISERLAHFTALYVALRLPALDSAEIECLRVFFDKSQG
jgi:hypothetical protein